MVAAKIIAYSLTLVPFAALALAFARCKQPFSDAWKGLEPLECDYCGSFHYHDNPHPEGSFQTYNGQWFCGPECGRKAGW